MKRILTGCPLILLTALMAFGQQTFNLKTASLTAANASCTATACAAMPVTTDAGAVVIQLAGTWSATVQFEGSLDLANYVAVAARPIAGGAAVTSTTANGLWVVNAGGLRSVRARVSARSSGTVAVTITRTPMIPPIYDVTLPGALQGTSVTSSGGVTATTGTFSDAVSGTTGTFSGAVAGTTGTFSDAVAGTTGTFTGTLSHAPANGSSVAIQSATELLTIAASATTDTTLDLPANAIILGVSVRVTTVIPTAATFTVTGATTSTAFQTGTNVAVAATTTDAGTKSCPYLNAAAQKVRITPNATPGANTGRVRVTVYYIAVTPPAN